MSVILNGKNVPGQIYELLPTVGMRGEKKTYLPDEEGAAAFEGFIGNSPAMEKVKQLAYKKHQRLNSILLIFSIKTS